MEPRLLFAVDAFAELPAVLPADVESGAEGLVVAHTALPVDDGRWNEAVDLAEPVAGGTSSGAIAAAPLSDTFLLHSLPGATKVIYLDFDGHTTTGTSWNTAYTHGAAIVTPAFSFEGDSSFSDNELTRIQAIWARVAEDYRPFEVDVTTQDPGVNALRKSAGNDAQYGIRVVIGGGWDDWYGTSAGGIAYVGSFDNNSDTPAFIFSENLSNGGEKSVAEAASHEAGHSLGLNHDGVTNVTDYYEGHGAGETGWAPIMGVSYYRTLTQWSKGEYPDASNQQDDLAVITQFSNGFGYRADDYGGSIAAAEPLSLAGTTLSGAGIIERNTDLDFFSFTTAAGPVSLTISPAAKGPNLDILAKLYDSNGALLETSNPESSLSASFSTTLAAGTYYVSIDGTGKLASGTDYGYTDYGSLGSYTIAGTVSEAATTGSIEGSIWHDDDRDGVRSPLEAGLDGWVVFLDVNNNGTLDSQTVSAATTSGPQPLANGATTISQLQVAGAVGAIADLDVTVSISHADLGELSVQLFSPLGRLINLVPALTATGANLTGTTFDDDAWATLADGAAPFTGHYQPSTPLAAVDGDDPNGTWTLLVVDAAGGASGTLNSWSMSIATAAEPTQITDLNGDYVFNALTPGDYVVRQLSEPGWDQTSPDPVGALTGGRPAIVAAGAATGGVDFGNDWTNPSADFNDNGLVDGGDFLAWQRGYRTVEAAPTDGDANVDTFVNAVDLQLWRTQYGTNPLLETASSSASLAAEGVLSVAASPVAATAEPRQENELIPAVELSRLPGTPLASPPVSEIAAAPGARIPIQRVGARESLRSTDGDRPDDHAAQAVRRFALQDNVFGRHDQAARERAFEDLGGDVTAQIRRTAFELRIRRA